MTGDPVWPGGTTFLDAPEGAVAVAAIGGVALADLAAAHGTPLYVMDLDEVVERMRRYRAAMGPDTDVFYASKALPIVALLRLAVQEGLGVDVASEGEMLTALHAGVPGERLVLHGNNKDLDELTMALDAGVGRIVVDSLDEVHRLIALGRPATLLLRMTPGVIPDTHSHIATAADDQKFGLSITRGLAQHAVQLLHGASFLRLAGLHLHIGSNIADGDDFAAGIRVVAEFASAAGVDLAELNLGGGLGIRYHADDRAPTIEQHVRTLLTAVDAALPSRPRLAVEPGRSLVGPAGVTLYRVGTVKRIPGVAAFVSVDGGMSDNLRPALYGARYTVAATRPFAAAALHHLAGSHCESGDVLARDVPLPTDVTPGDLVVTAATGAYGYAMANNYNRFRKPAVVGVRGGEARLLVRRQTLEDLVQLDIG